MTIRRLGMRAEIAIATAFAVLTFNTGYGAPKHTAVRFEWSQMLRSAGELQASLSVIDALRNDHPDNVDYCFARAQLLAGLGRDDEALAELTIASKLAPDYEDVWRLRFAILSRQQNTVAADYRHSLQQEASERFPKAIWWRSSATEHQQEWILTLGAGQDSLSNDLPNWSSQFINAQVRPNTKSLYQIQLNRDDRYAASDNSLSVGAERQFQEIWFAGGDFSGSSDPSFHAKFGMSLHAGRSLADGWVADLRYRRREYAAAHVDSLIGTIEKYYRDFRFAYSLGVSTLNGASNSASHNLSSNWYYKDRSSVGITLSTGDEAEAVGNGQVLETSVRGASLAGHHQFTDRYGLHWWLGTHRQGDFYRRRYFGLAVSLRI